MVIDTGIFIDFLRSKDKSKTILTSLEANAEIYISSVTVFELFVGATDSRKLQHVQTLIDSIPTVPFTNDVAQTAADLHLQLKARNKIIEFRDLFIAATALAYNQPLLTKNIKHFSRIDSLQLVNL